jgi:hypothetical protein
MIKTILIVGGVQAGAQTIDLKSGFRGVGGPIMVSAGRLGAIECPDRLSAAAGYAVHERAHR